MEQLEAKAEEFIGLAELRCKGWCHDKHDLRCKGWCHDITETKYQAELPDVEYFN
jgi:hypothetical protein